MFLYMYGILKLFDPHANCTQMWKISLCSSAEYVGVVQMSKLKIVFAVVYKIYHHILKDFLVFMSSNKVLVVGYMLPRNYLSRAFSPGIYIPSCIITLRFIHYTHE